MSGRFLLPSLEIGLNKYVIIFPMKTLLKGGGGVY